MSRDSKERVGYWERCERCSEEFRYYELQDAKTVDGGPPKQRPQRFVSCYLCAMKEYVRTHPSASW